ncbi:MAG: redoxin family protein, partial [Candidatus Aegiribacteria sp.]|nr:redoxin family protein [Candidatus Aegiribacteria sp.]
PVIRYSSGHGESSNDTVVQGPLLTGRQSLDSLLADGLGNRVVVNFWATWCTPCVAELPHIDRAYRESQSDVTVVAVDIGDPRLETLMDFREDFVLTIPVVWLSQGEAQALKDEWGLPDLLPVTVVLDADGTEIERISGSRDQDFFRSLIAGEQTADTAVTAETEPELHINVVGVQNDSATVLLMEASLELAESHGVDFYDPGIPSDSAAMAGLNLPFTGFSYAQPCIGSACGRLAKTPEELKQIVESLSN